MKITEFLPRPSNALRKAAAQAFLWCGLFALPLANASPTNIDRVLYFDADIRDAEFCELSVDANGRVQFGKNVTNPAMTCPDTFSWFLFANVVAEEFWTRWANEVQNWPEKPWPLCSSATATQCCDPDRTDNNPDHCPLFPGQRFTDKLAKAQPLLTNANAGQKQKSEKNAVEQFLQQHAELVRVGAPRGKGARPAVSPEDADGVKNCTDAQIDSVLPSNPQSIGRVLRQTNNELTIRNYAFHRYLFANDLYNANGVLTIFGRNDQNQQQNAPFHLANQSAKAKRPAQLATLDFPPDAIMIKSNWVSSRLVNAIKKRYPKADVAFGAEEDYIRHPMKTLISVKGGQCVLADSHYLMAFHVSSKDIPQWVWTTFEHKNNPGRCDYTGCNDSFGFLAQDPSGQATNFILPNQQSDQLAQSSIVFNNDKQYPDGIESEGLKKLLAARGIATQPHSGAFANPSDGAWRNYRLKGSQVEFTDHQGRPTRLGNSITEAGFLTHSSCIGCHARAGVAPAKGGGATFLPLGVFEPLMSEFGYEQSHGGVPNHAWFYNDSPAFGLEVLQTDFIWGFLNAQPLVGGK